MNIILVRPPLISFKKDPGIVLAEPLGLEYLAGFLKERGKSVRIFDSIAASSVSRQGCGNLAVDLEDRVRSLAPDIVGITCMSTQYSKGAHEAARVVKSVSKDIMVIFGGAHASICYENVLKDPNVDLVIRGEGEETLLEVVNRRENGQGLKDIKGTAVKIDGELRVNPPRPFMQDLDRIGFPARELLDMSVYYNDWYSVDRSMANPRLSMITSRGCPFNCVFCSAHSVWGNSFRARSPVNVVEEIERLQGRYGIKEIVFWDDNMTFDKKRINDICDEIIRRKIKVKWSTPNGVAIWTLDKPTLEKMKRAGCYKIVFGLESGCPKTLKFIRKDHIDRDKAFELVRFCNDLGLWTVSTFVIGFPYEAKEDIYQTLDFAVDSDVDRAAFYCATPYPGTELFGICKQEGLLPDTDKDEAFGWIGETGAATCGTKYMTKDEVDFLKSDLEKIFFRKRFRSFLNPARTLRKLKGFYEIRYFAKMLKAYFSMLAAAFRH